jgi:hypothetical protein
MNIISVGLIHKMYIFCIKRLKMVVNEILNINIYIYIIQNGISNYVGTLILS